MQEKNDQPSNFTNLIIIGLIILSAYLLYSLTLAFYKSHQIDIYINDFEEENTRIEEENKKLIEEFDYVTSDAYIDKILKQKYYVHITNNNINTIWMVRLSDA